jgi:hypothetical protein
MWKRLVQESPFHRKYTERRGREVNTPSYSGGPGFKSRPETGYHAIVHVFSLFLRAAVGIEP